jgi:hypothetical protein
MFWRKLIEIRLINNALYMRLFHVCIAFGRKFINTRSRERGSKTSSTDENSLAYWKKGDSCALRFCHEVEKWAVTLPILSEVTWNNFVIHMGPIFLILFFWYWSCPVVYILFEAIQYSKVVVPKLSSWRHHVSTEVFCAPYTSALITTGGNTNAEIFDTVISENIHISYWLNHYILS